MKWPFTRSVAARPANPGSALAKIGHEQRRAKYRATARAICEAMGKPVPQVLED